jgi:hypothetical protein
MMELVSGEEYSDAILVNEQKDQTGLQNTVVVVRNHFATAA